MTNDGPISSAPPPSSPNRWSARELLALMLGRDALPASGAADDGASGPAGGTLLAPPLQLFFLSFLMLFVELALIRWSGALVIYLSYFSNFVLLGSFLGIGIGFLRARARVNLFPWSPVALALLILFVRVFPVEVIRTGQQLLFFGYGTFHASGPPTWVTLPVVFLAVAAVMATIGEGVARTFIRFRPLTPTGSTSRAASPASRPSRCSRSSMPSRSSGHSSSRWSCCCSSPGEPGSSRSSRS